MNENDDVIAHDPIEDDPVMGPLVKQAEEEAIEALAKEGIILNMGHCYEVWGRQKKILKERHGIDWKAPDEMNPMIIFD
jgi:hypothetical protein